MTLATIFYALGIVYLIVSIVVVVAVVVVAWISYRKIKTYQDHLKAKIREQLNVKNLSIDALKSSYPLLVSGVMAWGLQQLRKKIFGSRRTA